MARPADVSKLFPKDLKYSGNSIEPLRRRFQTFKNAVGLCNIDLENTVIMFPSVGNIISERTGTASLPRQHSRYVAKNVAG